MDITSLNFPEAFAAMDNAAKEFWAYPDSDWQDSFLLQWGERNGNAALVAELIAF